MVAAAGNRGAHGYAAHAVALGHVGRRHDRRDAARRAGRARAPPRRRDGRPSATRPARLVLGARRRRRRARRPSQSRCCLPGSLDAARVSRPHRGLRTRCASAGSTSPRPCSRADGVGMVLLNTSRGQVDADFHSVPTVHLTKADARRLRAWLRDHPARRVIAASRGRRAHPRAPRRVDQLRRPRRLPSSSPTSSPPPSASSAPTPPSASAAPGTSAPARRSPPPAPAASPRSCSAAHDWSAAEVRSALATTAGNVAGDPSLLRLGAGRVRGPGGRPARPGVRGADRTTTAPGSTATSTPRTSTPLRRCSCTAVRRPDAHGDQRRHPADVLLHLRRRLPAPPGVGDPGGGLPRPGESATFRVTVSGGHRPPAPRRRLGHLARRQRQPRPDAGRHRPLAPDSSAVHRGFHGDRPQTNGRIRARRRRHLSGGFRIVSGSEQTAARPRHTVEASQPISEEQDST